LLAVGAAIFAPVAILFMKVALPFMIGSLMIAGGAKFLEIAAWSIAQAGQYLKEAGDTILDSATKIMSGLVAMVPVGILSLVAGAALAAGGSRLLIGSVAIGMAAYVLWNISSILLAAATDLKISGDHLNYFADSVATAGPKVIHGAQLLRTAAWILVGIGDDLVLAAAAIWYGSWGLVAASVAMTAAGTALILSSVWFGFGAEALHIASMPLIRAARNIKWSSDHIILAMRMLGRSIDVRSAVTNIEQAVTRITVALNGLEAGVDLGAKIEASIGRIQGALLGLDITDDFQTRVETSVSRILGALRELETGLSFEANIEALSNNLNSYAMLLENAAARVEAAIMQRALPAIKAARESGIDDVIKSEAITTVQVMDQREGEDDKQGEVIRLLSEQNALMVRFLETFGESKTTDAGQAITELAESIKEYMVDASQQKSMLSSVMNDWR